MATTPSRDAARPRMRTRGLRRALTVKSLANVTGGGSLSFTKSGQLGAGSTERA